MIPPVEGDVYESADQRTIVAVALVQPGTVHAIAICTSHSGIVDAENLEMTTGEWQTFAEGLTLNRCIAEQRKASALS